MISIIIPVYNAAQYIDQCLQSAIDQSYSDWECILVDDGSNDGSGAKCDEWCERDSRFRVIHQQNQGVSAARNNALSAVRGEWVTFIDSDDWVDSDYLTQMFNHSDGADLIVSGQNRFFYDGSKTIYMPDKTEVFVLNTDSAEKFNILNEKFLLYAPHEKFFRTEIIRYNNLRYDENSSYGEDLQFVYQYLEHIASIATVNKAMYHYRMGDGNTLSTKLRIDQFEVDYRQWKIVYAFYKQRNLLIEPANIYLAKRLWGIVYDGIFLYPKVKYHKPNYIKFILSIPDIEYLRQYSNVFAAANWIKRAILHRCTFAFWLFFKVCQ